jgi:hypothetical protein
LQRPTSLPTTSRTSSPRATCEAGAVVRRTRASRILLPGALGLPCRPRAVPVACVGRSAGAARGRPGGKVGAEPVRNYPCPAPEVRSARPAAAMTHTCSAWGATVTQPRSVFERSIGKAGSPSVPLQIGRGVRRAVSQRRRDRGALWEAQAVVGLPSQTPCPQCLFLYLHPKAACSPLLLELSTQGQIRRLSCFGQTMPPMA